VFRGIPIYYYYYGIQLRVLLLQVLRIRACDIHSGSAPHWKLRW
jgi:hypothetical protein